MKHDENFTLSRNELNRILAQINDSGIQISSFRLSPEKLALIKPHLESAMVEDYSCFTKTSLIRILSDIKMDPVYLLDRYEEALDAQQASQPGAATLAWTIGDTLSEVLDAGSYDRTLDLLRDRTHGRARRMLPYGLAKIRSRRNETVTALIELLDDEPMLLQAMAVLGKLKAVEAVQKIRELTHHPRRPVQAAAEKALAKILKDPKRFAKVHALKKEIPDIASAEFSFNWEAYDLADLLQRLINAGCLAIDHDTAQALGLFAGLMELEQVESFEIDPNPKAPVYLLLRCCDEGALDVDFWGTPETIVELRRLIEPILTDIEEEDAK